MMPAGADVVVLAGDISTGTRGVVWANATFSVPVVYVLGNHEFYGHKLDRLVQQCMDAAAPHVHVLERRSVEIDGVRFLGCTLWTDFRLFGDAQRHHAMDQAGQMMNDYRRIRLARDGFRRLKPVDTLKEHEHSRRWLSDELAHGDLSRTVVVTHHAPHRGSLASRFRDDPVSAAYVSDLSECLGKVPLWIHGHTHAFADYRVGETRVVCNPRGYAQEQVPGFSPDLLVTL